VRDVGFAALLYFSAGYAQILNSASLHFAGRYQILGTRGNIEVFNPVKPAPDGTTTLAFVTEKGGRQTLSFPPANQYALEFANFTAAVRTGADSRISLDNSLGNARCLDAVRASDAAAGTVVVL
jgi:predicted dehydrogenase